MPRLSVWCIRAALCHLGLGFTLGALMLAGGTPHLRSLHMEVLLLGWMVQLAFGTGYWILPRLPGTDRGHETLAASAIVLLNLGVLVAGLGGSIAAPPSVLVLGRVAELLAALGFAGNLWPRVRAYSSAQRRQD